MKIFLTILLMAIFCCPATCFAEHYKNVIVAEKEEPKSAGVSLNLFFDETTGFFIDPDSFERYSTEIFRFYVADGELVFDKEQKKIRLIK